MMVTLGVAMLRGRAWAGGAQREGKADDRKKSWKVLPVGETGRTWVRQQARDLCLLLILPNKSFSECKLLPHSIIWSFPM